VLFHACGRHPLDDGGAVPSVDAPAILQIRASPQASQRQGFGSVKALFLDIRRGEGAAQEKRTSVASR
jgi:hypothetical protein